MKFSSASASMLLALLPVATVNAELKCCWPIDIGNALYDSCNDMVDPLLIQDLVDAATGPVGNGLERRLGKALRLEDILKEDQVSAINEKRRALGEQKQRKLKKINLEAAYKELAKENCNIPFVNEDPLLWGACEPCGTEPTCVTNDDICKSLIHLPPIPLSAGFAEVTSMVCPEDEHDCCVEVNYSGVGLGTVGDGVIVLAFAAIVGDNDPVIEIGFTGFFNPTLDIQIDFTTGRLFEKICPKLGGDLCCQKDCAAKMDPHFKTWEGEWYDFQGECDLQFIKAPDFGQGQELDIQIRTTIRYDYSFIEAAAIKLGDDILEVSAYGNYLFNGVADATLPASMGEVYSVTHEEVNTKEHRFSIGLASSKHIVVSTYKDFVNVQVYNATESHFGTSTGLMGSYQHGTLQGRDGVTVFEDKDAFGQEWQVRDTEVSLFDNVRAPQYPSKCIMPDPTAVEGRRLGASIAEDAAEMACSHLSAEDKNMCIFDVMATRDLDVAQAGAY